MLSKGEGHKHLPGHGIRFALLALVLVALLTASCFLELTGFNQPGRSYTRRTFWVEVMGTYTSMFGIIEPAGGGASVKLPEGMSSKRCIFWDDAGRFEANSELKELNDSMNRTNPPGPGYRWHSYLRYPAEHPEAGFWRCSLEVSVDDQPIGSYSLDYFGHTLWSLMGTPFLWATRLVGVLGQPIDIGLARPNKTLPNDNDTTNSQMPVFTWENLGPTVAYRVQLDDDSAFNSVNFDETPTTNTWTPTTNLDVMTWYWRVRAEVGSQTSEWSTVWDVTIDTTPPPCPLAIAPADTTNQVKPMFDWSVIDEARKYNVTLYDSTHTEMPGFPIGVTQRAGEDKSELQYTATPLPEGRYTWSVEALDYATNTSGYCEEAWFIVDTTPPVVPLLVYPVGGEMVSNGIPVMDWDPIEEARAFNLQVFLNDTTNLLIDTMVSQAAGEDNSEYQVQPYQELPDSASFVWRARALDYATNASSYSGLESFGVVKRDYDAGVAKILSPAGRVKENAVIYPEVIVRNYGKKMVDFDVRTIIDDGFGEIYNSTERLDGVHPGEAREIKFADYWLATPQQTFHVRCTTELAGDEGNANDKKEHDFVVGAPFDEGWTEGKPMPLLSSRRPAKDGAWLAIDGLRRVYAGKGYKSSDFYMYDALRNVWETRQAIPADEAGKRRLPGKGTCGTGDGGRYVYMVKGNNTVGFWRYDVELDTWTRLPDVPLGPDRKRIKGGSDVVFANDGDTGYVYLLKGRKTEFYRYNTVAGRWDTLGQVPYGIRAKYDRGSFLAYDGNNAIYAHQAKYTDGTDHFMFKYDIASGSWQSAALKGMPLLGLHGGMTVKKRVKDGAAGAWENGKLYALKGGNTQQFFRYDPAGDSWHQMDTMPAYGSTGRNRRVKGGGDFISFGGGGFIALKGNKTLELWRYGLPVGEAARPGRSGLMAGISDAKAAKVELLPNPLTSGYATVRYSLPRTAAASVVVYDVAGRAVMRRTMLAAKQGAAKLDLRALAAGFYLVRFEADGYSATHKLVVQK